ncbi:MAG: RNA pyrophosphohydrolase [Pseudomonadota bacterium]
MSKKPRELCHEEKLALPYRPCVGAIVVNREGLAWVGRRLPNEEYVDAKRLWQFPQGGIDADEDPESAARRELFEETSIRSLSLLAEVPGWLTYDLPEELVGIALKGKFRGQKQRWFVYAFEGEESEINVAQPPDGHTAEFDAWEWIMIEDAPKRAVAFKVGLYQQLIEALRNNSALAWA